MFTARSTLNALHECIQQETELVLAFIALLEHEADILASGAQHNALAPVTARKNAYAEQLTHHAAKRNKILKNLGYGPDKPGLDAAVTHHAGLLEPVHELLDQTARASMLNTANGRIITLFLNNNQQALDVLHHLTGRSELYDATGQRHPTSQRRGTHVKAS